MLQGVCVLVMATLSYYFVYNGNSAKYKYSHLVFQINLNVFPIFYILMPSAFIIYTHYVNFSEDRDMIEENYRRYSTRLVDQASDEEDQFIYNEQETDAYEQI